jgi:hypothetical protein
MKRAREAFGTPFCNYILITLERGERASARRLRYRHRRHTELPAEARSAVLASYGMRAHQTPQGHFIIVWGVKQPTVAQTGNA